MFMDTRRRRSLPEYLEKNNKIPEKGEIVIFTGRKGEDTIWVEDMKIQDNQIYMKLSDIK